MSIEALRWALDIGEELELEPARRLVLIMLGNSADHAGGNLFPSYGYLTRRTGMAGSTIRRHVAALVKEGLLIREPRARGDGGQTSNAYRLSMRQPGLPLGDDNLSFPAVTPPLDLSGGSVQMSTPPAHQRAGGTSLIKDLKQELPYNRGRGAPSPVAVAFQAYSEGIKRKYNADYPPSAKANGQLANVVGRVGRDLVVAVVNHYLAHQDPFYARTKHSLDYLVRDCEKFSLEAQAAGAGVPRAPTHAKVALLGADGLVKRDLGEVPAGVMFEVARSTYRSYSQMASKMGIKSVAVRQGQERRIFTIEELSA